MKILRYNNATVAKFNNTSIAAVSKENKVLLQFKKLQTGKAQNVAFVGCRIRNDNLYISFVELNLSYEAIQALIKTLQTEIKRYATTRSNPDT